MSEEPVFIIDSADRALAGGRVYEITHIGNTKLGWMLSAESVRIRIAQKKGSFKMVDPITGYEEAISMFRTPDGRIYPRSHNRVRFTDALLGLQECNGCRLID